MIWNFLPQGEGQRRVRLKWNQAGNEKNAKARSAAFVGQKGPKTKDWRHFNTFRSEATCLTFEPTGRWAARRPNQAREKADLSEPAKRRRPGVDLNVDMADGQAVGHGLYD
ncbi:MAG: hypothetical protein LBJ64_10385 [Deltaproteobacteria bacterium]|jgi:hypothetical protein|nr:hypothetical protein [Deltaproteobacteria bacterium]